MLKEVEIECDGCGRIEYGGIREWREVWRELAYQGWRARKTGDDWHRLCDECLADGETFPDDG